MNEKSVALVVMACEKELLVLLPSAGTEMVTVLAPTFGSVMPVNVATPEAATARAGTFWVWVKVLAPEMVSVTGMVPRALLPALDTTPRMEKGLPAGTAIEP